MDVVHVDVIARDAARVFEDFAGQEPGDSCLVRRAAEEDHADEVGTLGCCGGERVRGDDLADLVRTPRDDPHIFEPEVGGEHLAHQFGHLLMRLQRGEAAMILPVCR